MITAQPQLGNAANRIAADSCFSGRLLLKSNGAWNKARIQSIFAIQGFKNRLPQL
jgi:hypothetical protein